MSFHVHIITEHIKTGLLQNSSYLFRFITVSVILSVKQKADLHQLGIP